MNSDLQDKIVTFQEKILSWNEEPFHKVLLIIYNPDPDSIIAAALFCRVLISEKINYMLTHAMEPISELKDRAPKDHLPYVVFIGYQDINLKLLPDNLDYLAFLKSPSVRSEKIICAGDFETNYPEINLSSILYHFWKNKISENASLSNLLILPLVAHHTIHIKEIFTSFQLQIFEKAKEKSLIEEKKTLGTDVFTIRDVLVYSKDPFLPNLTDNDNQVIQLLNKANITTETNEGERIFSDLNQDELKDLNIQLVKYLSNHSGFKTSQMALVRSKFRLLKEHSQSILTNTWDFAQAVVDAINQERYTLIIAVLLGNRRAKLGDLTAIYKQERKAIVTSHNLIQSEVKDIVQLSNLRYLRTEQPINWYNASSLASLALAGKLVDINQPFILIVPKSENQLTIGISTSNHLKLPGDMNDLVQEILLSKQLHYDVIGERFSAQVSVPEKYWLPIINELNDKLGVDM